MFPFSIGMLMGACFAIYQGHAIFFQIQILIWVGVAIISYLTLKSKPIGRVMAVFALAGILGSSLAGVQIYKRQNSVLPSYLINTDVDLYGTVLDGEHFAGRSTTTILVDHIEDWHPKAWYRAKVTLFNAPKAPIGELIHYKVKLKPPHSLYNPGSSDQEKYAFYRNMIATGSLKQALPLRPTVAASLKERLVAKVAQLLDNNVSQGAIIAMTLGEISFLKKDQWQVFSKTGTSHLMAISGLHVATIAGFFYTVCLFLCRRSYRLCHIWPAQFWSAGVAFIGAFLYGFISGFGLPTQRAVLMLGVVTIALLNYRKVISINALSAAMVLMLAIDPLAPLSKGFWLSFLCVMILIMTKPANTTKAWVKWVKPQLAIFFVLMPISIYFFQGISILAPIANFVAIPIVSLVVLPVSLLGVFFLQWFTPLGEVLINIGAGIFGYLYSLLGAIAQIEDQFVYFSSPRLPFVVLATISMGLFFSKHKTSIKLISVVFILPLLITFNTIPKNTLRLTFLEVGQGLSAIVQTKKHVLVFDAGPSSQNGNAGEQVILPFLRTQGIKHIDTMVISHADDDHAGGLVGLKNRFDHVLCGQPKRLEQKYGVPAQPCIAGQTWEWDDVQFTILSPDSNYSGKSNNSSCVLQISAANKSILLTGDIDSKMEHKLVHDYGNSLQSDILQVPHHGSKSSSSPLFIQTVQPQYAVFSVGAHNRFGFPKPEVIKRYLDQSCCVNRTTEGALSYIIDKEGIKMSSYRYAKHQVWLGAPIGG